jgi:nitrite reductase/ring-hydroxylating ferredoxin subunit
MSTEPYIVCPSSALLNGGLAYKLAATHAGQPVSVFFVRYQDTAYGYLNACPHMGAELDWESSVFTRAGDHLMCARHGATFMPATGECTGGPCMPSRLSALAVTEAERDGEQVVLWWPQGKTLPA